MAWIGGKSHHISRLACLAGLAVVISLSCTGAAADDKPRPVTREGAAVVADMIRKDLDRTVDPMSIKLSRQEKTTIGEVQKYMAKRKSAFKAMWTLFALFSAGMLAGVGTLASSSKHERDLSRGVQAAGASSILAALLAGIGMAPAGAVIDHADMKIAAHRKDLKLLFEKRLEKDKNDELKSRMLKRRIGAENGRLVGSKPEHYKHHDLIEKLTTTPDLM